MSLSLYQYFSTQFRANFHIHHAHAHFIKLGKCYAITVSLEHFSLTQEKIRWGFLFGRDAVAARFQLLAQ